MTTHGLPGTDTTLLVESEHCDSSISLRTGHRDLQCLKAYQNLSGDEGQKQQTDIFGSVDRGIKSVREVPSAEPGDAVLNGKRAEM